VVVQDVHGRLYEATYRGGVYVASVASVAPGTALATTNQAFCLYNPPGNPKAFSVLKVAYGYVSGTLGAGYLAYAYLPSTSSFAPTGTAITPVSTLVGSSAVGTGKPYSGVSGSTAPSLLRPSQFSLGATLATTAAYPGPQVEYIDGEFLVLPGGFFFVTGVAAAGSTPLVSIGVTYEEVTYP
jgi:hypothetical protein